MGRFEWLRRYLVPAAVDPSSPVGGLVHKLSLRKELAALPFDKKLEWMEKIKERNRILADTEKVARPPDAVSRRPQCPR